MRSMALYSFPNQRLSNFVCIEDNIFIGKFYICQKLIIEIRTKNNIIRIMKQVKVNKTINQFLRKDT